VSVELCSKHWCSRLEATIGTRVETLRIVFIGDRVHSAVCGGIVGEGKVRPILSARSRRSWRERFRVTVSRSHGRLRRGREEIFGTQSPESASATVSIICSMDPVGNMLDPARRTTSGEAGATGGTGTGLDASILGSEFNGAAIVGDGAIHHWDGQRVRHEFNRAQRYRVVGLAESVVPGPHERHRPARGAWADR
jgi:hypothetical protein